MFIYVNKSFHVKQIIIIIQHNIQLKPKLIENVYSTTLTFIYAKIICYILLNIADLIQC